MWTGPRPALTRNTIQSNTGQNAGGLYLSGSTAAVNGNRILHNNAGIGGGVYVQGGNPTLDNNVVAQNLGQTQAAGFYILSSSPKMRHNTIAANSGGEGSGLFITDLGVNPANIEFVNNIVVDHTTGITITAGNKITVRSTLWNNNGNDWGGDGLVDDQGGDVHEDPRFVAADSGDYHLESASPARDQGASNAGVGVDFDGQARPADQGYDIGADEFVFVGHPSRRADRAGAGRRGRAVQLHHSCDQHRQHRTDRFRHRHLAQRDDAQRRAHL